MATVRELLPGDLVELDDQSAVFICRVKHPLHPKLMLVVWRLHFGPDDWSFDALSMDQEVGQVLRATNEERNHLLRSVLIGSR
jgi:hypothetical protein